MSHTARHALRRPRGAALLPALLILTASSALSGMAVLPSAASASSGQPVRAAAAPAPPASPAASPAEQHAAARLAQSLAQERRHEQASRDRRPAPVAAPPVAAPPPPPPQFVRPGTGRLTSDYGMRWGRLHAGIDLAAGVGAPISAVAAGTVASAAREGAYGLVVRLQHADDTVTLYAHLSELLVQPGQQVTAGTYLGREGSSGRSTGPHLHFEVRVGGVPVDPEPWLRARGVDPAAH